jgi:hypothetical protein
VDGNRHVYGQRVPEAGQSAACACFQVRAGRQCRAEAVVVVLFRGNGGARARADDANGWRARNVVSITGGDAMGGWCQRGRATVR